MKFFFINQTFYPDVASTAQHLADLSLELVARGHQVTVVTGRRAYDDPQRQFPWRETWRGVRVLRVPSTGFGKTAKWRRALDCATFMVSCALRLVFLSRPDVIVALTSPPLISLLGLILARARRTRFVYWVMDLNPDEALAAGWLRSGSLSARFLDWLSRISLRKADRVIALDYFMLDRIAAKGVPSTRVSIVPPWSHDGDVRFDAAGRERFRKLHGLDVKFVIMYSGNHSPCHPLDTVIEAARRLANDPGIIICLVGGGTEFRKIQQMLKRESSRRDGPGDPSPSPRIVCLPYQPLDQLSASLSAADLHLVVMGDAFVGLTHPCKIYNILRVGAPLLYIGPDPSPVSEIIAALDGQFPAASLRHGDVNGLIQHIEHLRSRTLARATQPELCSRFSKQTLLPRLISSLEESLTPSPHHSNSPRSAS